MRRKRYEFSMTLTTTFLAHPSQAMKEHDRVAREVMSAIEAKLGGEFQTCRDCKTGRYRKLP